MRKSLTVLLFACLVVSSCGWRDSRLNPGNWFGSSQPVAAEAPEEVNPLLPKATGAGLFKRPEAVDASVLITQITELEVERIPTGAIVRATGLASRLGAYNVFLRRETPSGAPENGVLEYSFRASYPNNPSPQGTELARRVVVARTLNHKALEGVRVIRVTAAQNARESRRR